MTPYVRLYRSTSGPNDGNAGVTLYGTSSNRNGPRKIGSSAWSARWPNSAENRKPLNSVPASENDKRIGGAWCVCRIMPLVTYTCSVCSGSIPSMRNSSSLEKSSIPQSVCGAVRRVSIWPAYCKACTRCMAAPTNIFGGACIVGAS